jgi:hypothetical protein
MSFLLKLIHYFLTVIVLGVLLIMAIFWGQIVRIFVNPGINRHWREKQSRANQRDSDSDKPFADSPRPP